MRMLKPLVAAALLGAAGAASAQVTLTLSSWVPPAHLLTRAQADWCQEVSKATSSRIKCNELPKAAPVMSKPFHLKDLVNEVERFLAA